MPDFYQLYLEDWMAGEKGHTGKRFDAKVELGKDVYVQVFDESTDKFPLTTIQIENDNGKLMLRVWGDENQDPIHNIELPSNRDGRGYDLKTGEEVANDNTSLMAAASQRQAQ